MVIRRSAAADVRALVERLVGNDPLEREAASARLAILGTRAVATLTRAVSACGSTEGCVAILRTLEAIHDARAVAPALRLADSSDSEIATAAVGVLRRFLRSSDAALANAAFSRLTAVTLDSTRPEPVRTAALEALSDLPQETTAQVVAQLREDPSARFRRIAANPAQSTRLPLTLAEAAAAARCPDPAALRALVTVEGASVPLGVLGRLIDVLRAREASESAPARRTEWQAARAAVHQALAARGSRLALYDLRETLAAVPGPLPVGFMAALDAIGDASCLDDLAAAYVRARRARDAWWIEHLAAVFTTIVRRERLTRRSPAVRRVTSKWPQAAADLLSRPSRTRRPR